MVEMYTSATGNAQLYPAISMKLHKRRTIVAFKPLGLRCAGGLFLSSKSLYHCSSTMSQLLQPALLLQSAEQAAAVNVSRASIWCFKAGLTDNG